MVFYRDRLKPSNNTDITIDGNLLTKVKSAKCLGVIFDHILNWIDHIAIVTNIISKGIGSNLLSYADHNRQLLLKLIHHCSRTDTIRIA